MSEHEKLNQLDEMSPIDPKQFPNLTHPTDEYKVGHTRPPLFLIVLYVLVIIWAGISWIPFYGY